MLSIESVHRFPVKSCAELPREGAARLDARGFEFDRRWMITDQNGKFITQRQAPLLATIQPHLEESDLVLVAPKMSEIRVPLYPEPQASLSGQVWKDKVGVQRESAEVSERLSRFLGREAHLVRKLDAVPRYVDKTWVGENGAELALQDQGQLLITSVETLEMLNGLRHDLGLPPISMDSFRSNIVISGGREEYWSSTMSFPKRGVELDLDNCVRCGVTDINQQTGVKVSEAERVSEFLKHHHTIRSGEKNLPVFGMVAVVRAGVGAELAVGDEAIIVRENT